MSYATSVHTVFDQTLSMLDGLLAKAQEHDKGDDLLAVKLAEDMLPMATQVRYAGHQVVNTLNLLAGGAYTRAEEDTDTLAQARAFIAEMRALIADHPPQSWASAGTQVDYGPGEAQLCLASARIHARLGHAQFLFPRDHRLRNFAQRGRAFGQSGFPSAYDAPLRAAQGVRRRA